MTVLPGMTQDTVNLICDQCGESLVGVAVLRESDVVWTVIAEYGWDGAPFAVGPHRCPSCAAASLAGTRVATTASAGGRTVTTASAEDRPDWQVESQSLPWATVLTPSGDLDHRVAHVLRAALAKAFAAGRDVALDLSRVRQLDSTGLGLLVRAHRDSRQCGRRFCLVAPSRFVRTVLHTMRLDAVFLVFEDRATAERLIRCPRQATASAAADDESG